MLGMLSAEVGPIRQELLLLFVLEGETGLGQVVTPLES